MLTLELSFPAGHYHATPPGSHVNEGQVEWPPSPWRLLRALIATGFVHLGWSEVPAQGRALIESLASALPSFHLPRATVGHSRHWMPLARLEKGVEMKTLVFDTFADVGNGRLLVTWPIDLPSDQRTLLGDLVSRLHYLGRAESWTEARILESGDELPPPDAWPEGLGRKHSREFEELIVQAPVTPAEFDTWCQAERNAVLARYPLAKGRRERSAKARKDIANEQATFPIDFIDALQWDTSRWQAGGWPLAPGARRVLYWRRRNALSVGANPPHRRKSPDAVRCMLLAMATASRNTGALPSIHRTLPQAELLHRALAARADGQDPAQVQAILGRDAMGAPLQGHRHLRILPLDLDGDAHLDHLLLTAAMGLNDSCQELIRGLRLTWQKGGHDLQLALVGLGEHEDLRNLSTSFGEGVVKLLGPRGGARDWISATPFVAPRFLKAKGHNTLEGQVRAEIASHGLPDLDHLEVLDIREHPAMRHAILRRRPGKPQVPVATPWALRLRFNEPVHGPISLGFGCHFGLGRFDASIDFRVSCPDPPGGDASGQPDSVRSDHG